MGTTHLSDGQMESKEPPISPLVESGSSQVQVEQVGPGRLMMGRVAEFCKNLVRREPMPDEPNARRLYIEVSWAQVQVALTQFNAPFALRLGATNPRSGCSARFRP